MGCLNESIYQSALSNQLKCTPQVRHEAKQ